MTPEEAGQLLLEGVSWMTCPKCCGNGEHDSSPFESCSQCHGAGKVADPVSVEACELLGKSIPMLPSMPLTELVPKRTVRQIQEYEDSYILAAMSAPPGEPSDS